jgi:hypothetical protein
VSHSDKRDTKRPQNSSPLLKRVAQACEACARSKLRCDDKHPCYRCESSGIQCILPSRTKSPRKSSRSLSAHSTQRMHIRHSKNNINPAQALAGTNNQNLNAPQSRDDGLEESLDGAQPPPSTIPMLKYLSSPGLPNDDSLTPQTPSMHVGGCTYILVATGESQSPGNENISPLASPFWQNTLPLRPQRETLEQQDSHTSEHFQYCQAQEKATWEEAQVANYANPQTNSSQTCVRPFQDAFPGFQFSDEVWNPSPNQSNLSASQNSELAAGSQNMLSSQINGYVYLSLENPWDPSSF